MTERDPDATLNTLHDDLMAGFADLKGEMRSGLGDVKAALIAGFRSLPSRESSEEMVRLLREGNRLQEERLARLDVRIREQHLETQQTLHAIVAGQGLLIESQRALAEGQRDLAADIRRLIARIDALIKGRDNGEPAP